MKFATLFAIPAIVANAASVGLKSQSANFDDITVALPGLPLQPIGTYRDLVWDNFNVISVKGALTGVTAQSSPNVALTTLLSTGLGSTATLKPASSKTIYFSLQSFYFGCVASSQETLTGVPLSCSLTLTGKRKGKVVVTQQISFTPANLLKSAMKKQTFAGAWSNVDSVEFKQTSTLAAATSVLYDNFQFTTFTTK